MSHARLAPSDKTWPHCPAAPTYQEPYPDVSGAAAIDGTGSHLLLELCIEQNRRADSFIDEVIGIGHEEKPMGWHVDAQRAERVNMVLSYIERRKGELSAAYIGCTIVVEAESKTDPGGFFGRDDWYGTADVTLLVLNPAGGLHFAEMIDLKDGRGYVDVHENSQLESYLFGKIRPYVGTGPDLVRPFRPERVGACRMTIVQPKTNPAVRYVDITPQALFERAQKLAFAAHQTDDSNAEPVAGSHCRWCKANPKNGGHCTANLSTPIIKELTMSEGNDMLEVMQRAVADPKSLDSETLAKYLGGRDAMNAVFDAIEAELTQRLESGEEVSGWGLQPGRGSNVWAQDEETTVKKLKGKRLKLDEIYPKKLASPAQIQKLESLTDTQKKKIEDELVTFKAGKMKLVRQEHKRVEKDVDAMFEKADSASFLAAVSDPEPEQKPEPAPAPETFSFL